MAVKNSPIKQVVKTMTSLYPELIKSENLIQLENLSLDFMVQNEVAWDDFRQGVIRLRSMVAKREPLNFGKFKIVFVDHRLDLQKVSVPELAAPSESEFRISLFDDKEQDAWLVDQISELIDKNAVFQIVPGLLVYKEDQTVKLVCSRSFIDGKEA